MRMLKLHARYIGIAVAALITLTVGPVIAQRHKQRRPIVSVKTSVLAQPGWQAGSQAGSQAIDPKSDTIRPTIEERMSVASADVSPVTVVQLETGGQMAQLPEAFHTYSIATITNGKVRITEVSGQSEAELLVRNGKRTGDVVSNGKGDRDVR